MTKEKSKRGGKIKSAGRKATNAPKPHFDDLKDFNYAAEMAKLLENVDAEYIEAIKNLDNGDLLRD